MNPLTFDHIPQTQLQQLEFFLKQYFDRTLSSVEPDTTQKIQSKGYDQLLASIRYSLFSGGKRFRPMVGYLLGEALDIPINLLTPWLAAVECIHTYSLIHDDLPCMDNDSMRRGKPTNHIVFGETTALLAGDALLTEAFNIIGEHYSQKPELGLPLVRILAQASGTQGMVTGQALDLALDNSINDAVTVKLIHQLKTGALIHSVAAGVATLAHLPESDQFKISQFGKLLGFAFQLKDDLLDFDPHVQDTKNLVNHIGVEETKALLISTSQMAKEQLAFLSDKRSESLLQLIQYNINREV